jgi:hypothetical protein
MKQNKSWQNFLGILISFVFVAFFFFLFENLITKLAKVTLADFNNNDSSVILFFFQNNPLTLFILLFSFPLFTHFKSTFWSTLKINLPIKIIVLVCVVLITWILVFETYSFYFNSWLIPDRILILLLALLIFYHPGFIFPFALVVTIFYNQYFCVFDWEYKNDFKPIFNVLYLSILIVYTRFKWISQQQIILLILISVLSSYFYSGIGKILMSPNGYEWITQNELFLLPLNAQLRGWFSWAPQNLTTAINTIFLKMHPLFAAIILIIEVSAVIALTNRKLIIYVLGALTIMHFMIAVTIGIFFWAWMILNVVIMLTLVFHKIEIPIFQSKTKYLQSILLVIAGIFLFNPFSFSWFDSRYQWFTIIEVYDINNNKYTFNKNNFGGYSYIFAHDYLHPIIPNSIPGVNGYSAKYEDVQFFKNANPKDMVETKSLFSYNHFNLDWKTTTETFLRKFFKAYNENHHKTLLLNTVTAPRQLYMYCSQDNIPRKIDVNRATIVLEEYFYFKGTYQLINKKNIIDVAIF